MKDKIVEILKAFMKWYNNDERNEYHLNMREINRFLAQSQLPKEGEDRKCPTCDGLGEWPDEDGVANCEMCNGTGTLPPFLQQSTKEELFKILAGKCISDASARQAVKDIVTLLNR